MLLSSMDCDSETDGLCVEKVLDLLVAELDMNTPANDLNHLTQRSPRQEVTVVIMRLLSKSYTSQTFYMLEENFDTILVISASC